MRKPCCDKQEMNKGAWSKQEDQKLIDYINKHGEGCWRTLPQAAGLLRCGKSCRLRWINYLRPDLKRGNFAEDEEDLIIKLHALLGNRWSLIAGRLPGRTDNEVKNYWNSHLRRKLINMGVDPNNHRLSGKFSSLHNHHHHHHQNQTMSGTSITSSGLKQNIDNNVIISKKKDNDFNDEAAKGDHDHHQVGVFGEINNYEQVVSDAASGLEDESYGGGCLPDLNLDLTISIPNSSSLSIPNTDNGATHHGEEIKQNPIHHHHHHEYSKSSSRDQIHFASSPTLVLFQ